MDSQLAAQIQQMMATRMAGAEQEILQLRQELSQAQQLAQQAQQAAAAATASTAGGVPANVAEIIYEIRINNQNSANMAAQIEAQQQVLKKIVETHKPTKTLIDPRGLGKPQVFKNDEDKFQAWAIKIKGYVLGIYPDLRDAMAWAAELTDRITEIDLDAAYGDSADDVDKVEDLENKDGQLYTAPLQRDTPSSY